MEHYIGEIPEISLEGYMVVSGEYFPTHTHISLLPACSIWNTGLTFNRAAVTKLDKCEKIKMEINPKTKGMIIFPVTEKDADGIKWVKGIKDLAPQRFECKEFIKQLYKEWNLDLTKNYRAQGRLVTSNKKVMMFFDFRNCESWTANSK